MLPANLVCITTASFCLPPASRFLGDSWLLLLGGWGFPEDPVCLQCPVQIMTPRHLPKPASETPMYHGDKKR